MIDYMRGYLSGMADAWGNLRVRNWLYGPQDGTASRRRRDGYDNGVDFWLAVWR